MNPFAWLWDQFSMTHKYDCTHCGQFREVTEISWYYSAYAPKINYPLKRRSIHENWLCKECWDICYWNYMDPTGKIKELFKEVME